MTLDPNLTLVLLALVGVVVPLCTLVVKFIQDSRIARESSARATAAALEVRRVAAKVEEASEQEAVRAKAKAAEVQHVASALEEDRKAWGRNQDRTDKKLDEIHVLVNSQLSEAVSRFKDALVVIDELKRILIRLAPNDPHVQELTSTIGR